MISTSRGESSKDLQAKQEGDTNINNNNEASKFPKAPSSSRQWSAFRNPRIVRVSRTFGGKDRHSKVCTVRGLRDRRIRLSVPTAIQLYDLQDRLGVNQPSKVIDWLLDATKNDIDSLPPLQMPQGFGQFHSPMFFPHHDSGGTQSAFCSPNFFDPNNSSFLKDGGFHPLGIKIGGGIDGEDHGNILARSKYWEVEASMRAKSKEVEGTRDKGKWVRSIEEEEEEEANHGGVSNYGGGQVLAHKLFPLTTSHPSLPAGLLGNHMPFSSYYHLDASNLSLAQLGSQGFLSQPESSFANNNGSNNNIPLPGSHHQLLFCPQPATLPSLFPAYPSFATPAMEGESRDINNVQLLGSNPSQSLLQSHHLRATSYPVRPFALSVNPGLDHTMQASNESHLHQERDTDDS